jgi:hypothetical protein
MTEQYPHDILPFPHLQIYDIYSFIVPCHDDVLILGINVIKKNVWACMLASFTLVLITWHGCFCIKKGINVIASTFGIIRTTQIVWSEHFFPNVSHQLPPTIWIIHMKKEIFKFHFQTPYIHIMVTEIEFNP